MQIILSLGIEKVFAKQRCLLWTFCYSTTNSQYSSVQFMLRRGGWGGWIPINEKSSDSCYAKVQKSFHWNKQFQYIFIVFLVAVNVSASGC